MIVGGIFGGLFFILIVGALVAVCYSKYKRRNEMRKTIPTITRGE